MIMLPGNYCSTGINIIGGPVSDYPVNSQNYTYGYSFVPLVLGNTGICVFERDVDNRNTVYTIPASGSDTYIMGLRGYSGDIFRELQNNIHVATQPYNGDQFTTVLLTAPGWYFGMYCGSVYISGSNLTTGTFTFTLRGSSSETIKSIQAYILTINATTTEFTPAMITNISKSSSTYTVSYSVPVYSNGSYTVHLEWIAFTGY